MKQNDICYVNIFITQISNSKCCSAVELNSFYLHEGKLYHNDCKTSNLIGLLCMQYQVILQANFSWLSLVLLFYRFKVVEDCLVLCKIVLSST